MSELRQVSEIVYREDLYPRINHDPSLVQRYAQNLEVMPPIEINQDNILIDGWHRWTAHKSAEINDICVTVTETSNETEVLELAIQRNAAHGLQLSLADKKELAQIIYEKTPLEQAVKKKEWLAQVLSVAPKTVQNWLQTIDEDRQDRRDALIFDLWQSCHTQEEIAEVTDLSQQTIGRVLQEFVTLQKVVKLAEFDHLPEAERYAANLARVKEVMGFAEEDYKRPIYNVWTFGSKTNNVSHFGNSEQRIVDNLLYLYTQPFDIVLDPFAGGGSTIDVCRHRLRRYWTSDRKPIVERAEDIRQHDIVTDGLPALRWSDVSLTYLDPPYWRQAEGKYSKDPTDLANMPLEQFTATLVKLVKDISRKQSKGAIALLIQPTQWLTDNREFADHVTDLVSAIGNKRLILENRVSCPYATEQYNAQQVEWAKENKKLLVLTRELIVWRLVD